MYECYIILWKAVEFIKERKLSYKPDWVIDYNKNGSLQRPEPNFPTLAKFEMAKKLPFFIAMANFLPFSRFQNPEITICSLCPISFMTPYKKRTVHVYSIANFIAHELNDSKLFQMNSNDFSWFIRHIETHLESFQSIWSHISHEATKLAIL